MQSRFCKITIVWALLLLRMHMAYAQTPDMLHQQVRADLQAQLKKAQKLKLAGIVLTSAAPVLEGAALAMLFTEGGFGDKEQTGPPPLLTKGQQRWNHALPPLFWFCGATAPAAFLSGVPLLVTGMVRERRYKKLMAPVQLQTGWLPDGKIGLAVNF